MRAPPALMSTLEARQDVWLIKARPEEAHRAVAEQVLGKKQHLVIERHRGVTPFSEHDCARVSHRPVQMQDREAVRRLGIKEQLRKSPQLVRVPTSTVDSGGVRV